MSLLVSPRFSKYQDFEKKISIRTGIDELLPYEVTLPDPPKPEQFVNFGLPIEQQFFKPEVIPGWVWQLTRMAKQKVKMRDRRSEVMQMAQRNDNYASFIESQWRKREHGIFIYIYGRPTYIPGPYWWNLSYYHMDVGLPDYRFVDLDYAYWWKYCVEEDDNVYGGDEFTMRRDGKSYRGCSNILEVTTRNEFFNSGIQSKTNEDAKDLFQRGIVLPWHRLPFYFSPKYDSKTYPVKEINFRDKFSEFATDDDIDLLENIGSDELNSWIEARATVYTAFDGVKLKRYLFDEAGKTEEMLASQAWRVHKQCLRVRNKIVGKALLTTTIEETTKGGLKEFKKIWGQSDRRKITRLGQTNSGLVPFFKPAWETFVFDQYGYSIIDDPMPHQAEWRKKNGDKDWDKGGRELVDLEINSEPDAVERQKIIRMYPRTIREAMRADVKDCEFNVAIINERLDDFLYGNDLIIRGNLDWENGVKDSKAYFEESPNGRWTFTKELMPWLIKNSNHVLTRSNLPYPGNLELGGIGADPYKFNVTEQSRKSLGTAHGYINLILEIDAEREPGGLHGKDCDWLTDDLFFEYGHRHYDKRRYGEDMILTCHFLGMQIFPEINVPFIWDYFLERGYEFFLKYRKLIKRRQNSRGIKVEESKTPGMNTLGDSIKEPLFSHVGSYIQQKGLRCKFPNFLEDCRDVEYGDMNPYDYFVSGAYSIYTSKPIGRPKRDDVDTKSFDGLWTPNVVG